MWEAVHHGLCVAPFRTTTESQMQVKVEHHLNASDYYFVCSLHERASKKIATMCKIAYQQLFNERISAQGIRYR